MADLGPLQSLNRFSFPSALDRRDRHVGWFALTIGAGIVAALLALLVTIIVLMIGYMAFSDAPSPQAAVGAFVGDIMRLTQGAGPPNIRDQLFGMTVLILPNVVIFIVPVVVAALIASRPFRLYLTAAARFRWKMLFNSMLVMAVVLLPIFVILNQFDPARQAPPLVALSNDPQQRMIYAAAAFAFLLPAAAAEEVLFRGWLLRQTLAFFRSPWLALVINGALFALAHVNPNPDDSFQLAMMGAAFAYMSIRLGGIEFACGAHAVNNILLVLFFQTLPFTGVERHEFSPGAFAGGFAVPIACVLVTELVIRWAPLRRFVGAESLPPPADS